MPRSSDGQDYIRDKFGKFVSLKKLDRDKELATKRRTLKKREGAPAAKVSPSGK